MALNLYEQIEQAAEGVRRGVQKSQGTYEIYATAILCNAIICSKNPEDILSEIARQYEAKHNNIGEGEKAFFDRLVRNTFLMKYLSDEPQKLISRNTARELTDKWQDFEILENMNTAEENVCNMLQAWREFWLDDKQSGKLPESNNYGAILERRLNIVKGKNKRHTEPAENPNNALWVLGAWHSVGHIDIFAGVGKDEFLQMVESRNFSSVYSSCGDKKNLLVSLSFVARSIYNGASAQDVRVLNYLQECKKYINAKTDVKMWNVNTTKDTKNAKLSAKFTKEKKRDFSV